VAGKKAQNNRIACCMRVKAVMPVRFLIWLCRWYRQHRYHRQELRMSKVTALIGPAIDAFMSIAQQGAVLRQQRVHPELQ
jgi:hypothetical protein